jgi:dCTP deaminase
MSVLSDKQIEEEFFKDNIVIQPFNSSHMGNCSYDVTLGEWYYRGNPRDDLLIYNPWHDDIDAYWTSLNQAREVTTKEMAQQYHSKIGDKIIVIQPNELILGHTQEFIGGRNNITTMMKTRSSLGRSGISVCKCAGWGDVGYFSRWTMEIQNTLNVPVVLTVGKRIAQIVFMYTGEVSTDYNGKYQKYSCLDRLMHEWKPDWMLPRLDKDT